MEQLAEKPDVTEWKRECWNNGVVIYSKGNEIMLCDLDGKWWKVK